MNLHIRPGDIIEILCWGRRRRFAVEALDVVGLPMLRSRRGKVFTIRPWDLRYLRVFRGGHEETVLS